MARKSTTTTKAKATATTAKRASPRRRKTVAVSQEQIAERAYFLSLEGGADPVANWLQAERELVAA